MYLDTSVVVALLTPEPFSQRAIDFVAGNRPSLLISDFCAAEFASALCRRVRTGDATVADARLDLAAFDSWTSRSVRQVQIIPADIAAAASYLRRLDLPLRTPDAIHIAVAQRLGAPLVTFDRRMATTARAIGVAIAEP